MTDLPGPPETQPERFEWIHERAKRLDLLRGSNWIADEIETLWNDPEAYEEGDLYGVPEDVDEADYVLFRLGVAFGTEYEHEFPRGEDYDA